MRTISRFFDREGTPEQSAPSPAHRVTPGPASLCKTPMKKPVKREKKEKTPEALRDTSHLPTVTKRLGIASICGLSLLLGFLAGAVVWVVLRIMSLGISALWTWLPAALGLGRSLPYYLTVCLIGGLLIGLLQRQVGPLPDNMEQVLGRIKRQGGYPYDRLHIIAVCALLPLIFGGALGPEAGLSGLVAGLCCWVGDRLKCKGDEIVALAGAGFAATLGVIFHAPLFGIAMDLESDEPRTRIVPKRTRVVIYCFGVFGGMLAFGLLGKLFDVLLSALFGPGAVAGGGLPRFNAEHAIGLSQWKWFIPLLAAGLLFSLFYMLIEKITRRLGDKLSGRPVISCLIPGLCMAVCGYCLPLTMFSGETQLEELIDGWQTLVSAGGTGAAAGTIDATTLILTAVIKLALVSLCINFGWRGGSIFPIIFSGACVGYAFALIVGMDGAFAAAVVIASLYAYQMRKPIAVIMVLLLCFPVTYIIPVGVAAFIAAKIPSPFARKPEAENPAA